jgi:peroxiredoxin
MSLLPQRSSLLLLCLAVVAASGATGVMADPAPAGNKVGVQAPELALSDGIHGVTAKTKIGDYKGKVTLLVIWLPICPHCKKFMPEVGRLWEKYTAKGLAVVTVTHGKKDYTAEYLAERKWTFGVGFDYTGVTAKRYGMKQMPGVYLIGSDNKLRSYDGTLEQAIIDELAANKKSE